jgi:hypothetical protein
MRPHIYAVSAAAAAAIVGLAGPAMAGTSPAGFTFSYDSHYGDDGLSQAYTAPTPTGQSYGTGVAIDASDPKQRVYSLVEATANVGVGGVRGAFPASSRTVPASATTPSYLGPYSIVQRDSNGQVDTTFGDKGYVTSFPNAANSDYKFTGMCVDPGTGDIIVVGQETTSSGTVGVVERLRPPAKGSSTASLDTSFNRGGAQPGVVTIATPDGNGDPALNGCTVADAGPGRSGAVIVGGVDDSTTASLLLAGRISSSGSPDKAFGTDGIAEYPVDSVDGSGTSAEIMNVALGDGRFPDVILSGFSLKKGAPGSPATALTVALKDTTGALDTNFNGTGQLVNPAYGEAVLARVTSGGGTAPGLSVVYATVGSDIAEYADYPVSSAGVPDLAAPATTTTGTFTVPAGFAAMQGYTADSSGQIVVSGDTTSDQEQLTEISGSRALGY